MKDILSKYTERLATQESMAIDNFIMDYIPKWQVKVMRAVPFTKKLFGWEIRTTPDWIKPNTRVELLRYGQNVAELKIIVKVNTQAQQHFTNKKGTNL